MGASFIQGDKIKQLKSKLDLNGDAVLDGSAITASRVVISDGSKNIQSSTITTTELGRLSGVSADIQTQLDGKLAASGGSITGNLTVTGILEVETSLRLEDPGAGTNTLTLQAPTLAGNISYTLPVAPSAVSLVLSSTTAGIMTWEPQSGGGYAYDISPTTAAISNNISAAADITGLSLNSANVKSAKIQYHIYRDTSASSLMEAGTFELAYKASATSWNLTNRTFGGDTSGITLTATTAGQVQYTSTNITGTGYSGVIAFRGSALPA